MITLERYGWYVAEYPNGNILFKFNYYKDKDYIIPFRWKTISGRDFIVTGIVNYGIYIADKIRKPTDDELTNNKLFMQWNN